ncbi:LPS export ABC transporter permease LptG [Brevundimonas sp. 2R-24]|uniref:LPS export ABC transporter permease LptG n=1 Tax=Peiella sedimenti TaxID=3061083 RepID=A0ABT8SK38_9CAUL|nr:LPS export ABC transporter permease LptG [Caulobacteraceae bacterium XZ-24]
MTAATFRRASALPGALRNYQGRLTRIERYVLVHTLRSIAAALAIIAAVIMLIDFVEISRNVNDRVEVSAITLMGLTLEHSPAIILQLLPFVFLFGVLAAFVQLNRRSELIAMRAAGVSAWRFIFPAAGAAFVIGMLTVAALNPLASWLDGDYQRRMETLSRIGPAPEQGSIWLREGDAGRQVVIRARAREGDLGQRLRDASFFIYTTGPDGRRVFSERIEAQTATLRRGGWELVNARGARQGEQAERYDRLSLPSTLTPETAFEGFAEPRSISFWSLPGTISRIEAAGFSATSYRLRLHELLATPLLFAGMSMLAAAFSLRLMRLGDLATLATSGVGLGFMFFFFQQFCAALAQAEVLPTPLAAWAPPLLVLLSALTLLCYTEDG